ncbi:MAG: UDP-N-acetylmuramoyl-tripeptide--D-alanyl-D-alanine ligase [Candidatus Babeliales bacterium]
MKFDEAFVRRVVSSLEVLAFYGNEHRSFSCDKRRLRSGDLFIALKDKRGDGHDDVCEVLRNGASGCMIEHSNRGLVEQAKQQGLLDGKTVLLVQDTRKALIELARAWRKELTVPIVAITGSVGKTSVKYLVERMMRAYGKKTFVSCDNQHTLIDIALSLLNVHEDHEVAFFEVGVHKHGEMIFIADMLRPDTAVITNIGHAHMEGLGSLQAIAAEQRQIFSFFVDKNVGIIDGDQPLLASIGYMHPVVKFGFKMSNQVQARKLVFSQSTASFVFKIYHNKYSITTSDLYEGMIKNKLAAAALAYYLGVPEAFIIKGIEEPFVVPGRFERKAFKDYEGSYLIYDAYNAHPESMRASLFAFDRYETESKKVALLGDMHELGIHSSFWHRQLGRLLYKVTSLDRVILVGKMVEWTRKTVPVNLPVTVVSSWEEALHEVGNELKNPVTVLVKGSKAKGLDDFVSALTEE